MENQNKATGETVLKEETELDALPYIKTFNEKYNTNIVYAENGVSSIEKYIDEHPDEDKIYFVSRDTSGFYHFMPVFFERRNGIKKFFNSKLNKVFKKVEIFEYFLELDSLGCHSLFIHNRKNINRMVFNMNLPIQFSHKGCLEYSCEVLRDINVIRGVDRNSIINFCIENKDKKLDGNKKLAEIMKIERFGIIKKRYKLKKIPPILLKYIERYDTMRDLRFNQSEIFKDKSLSIPFVGSDKNPCDKNFVMFFDNMDEAIKSGNFTSRFSEKNSMSKIVKPQHFENFYEKNGEVDKNKERDIQTRNFQERYENTKSYYLEPEEQDNFYRKF